MMQWCPNLMGSRSNEFTPGLSSSLSSLFKRESPPEFFPSPHDFSQLVTGNRGGVSQKYISNDASDKCNANNGIGKLWRIASHGLCRLCRPKRCGTHSGKMHPPYPRSCNYREHDL